MREKKKERKSSGCLAFLQKVSIVIITTIVVMSVLDKNSSNSNSGQTATPDSASVADVTATPKPTNTPKPTSTPEPTTLEGWAESIANDVYGDHGLGEKYNDLISVTCMNVDGENAPMVTINVKYPASYRKADDRMGSFLYNAKEANAKFAERAKEGKLEYGSLMIAGWTTFADKYGNESDGQAASIRVKASEAAKVNWDTAHFTAEMLPGVAVSFGINPIIRDGISAEYLAKIRN